MIITQPGTVDIHIDLCGDANVFIQNFSFEGEHPRGPYLGVQLTLVDYAIECLHKFKERKLKGQYEHTT